MKIVNNVSIQSVAKAYQKTTAQTEKKAVSGFETDKIEISQEARIQQAAMKAAKQLPDIRESKVAEIKQQIQDGVYNPTADQIMEKMLQVVK